jgi:hypothetical protein
MKNDDIKTTTNIPYLLEELIKCNPLTESNTDRAAIINWRLTQLGHFQK